MPSGGASSSDVLLVGEAPNSPSRSTVAPNGDACRAAASLPPVASDWVLEGLLSAYEAFDLFRFLGVGAIYVFPRRWTQLDSQLLSAV
jgi:hypothetical protein